MTDHIRRFARDPVAFFASLEIPTPRGPQMLGECWADFQRTDFQALAPSLLALANGTAPPCNRFWQERCKGSSKDGDAAAMALWLLAFSPRKLSLQICAVDSDQGNLVKHAADDRLRLNPYLYGRIESQANRLINPTTGSVCETISTDVPSVHGQRPAIVFFNELAHFANRQFFDAVLSNVAKNPNTLLCVLTNAGWTESFAYALRNEAVASPRWYFSAQTKPAPWISPDDVAEQERLLPPAMFARLWRGEWSSGSGDLLSGSDLEAAIMQPPSPHLPAPGPLTAPQPNSTYVIGVDLSIKRDRSAVVCLGRDRRTGRVRLATCRSWKPGIDGKIDLLDIQAFVEKLARTFRATVAFDPYQAELLNQYLQRQGIRTHEVTFQASNLTKMASVLMESFRDRTIDLYRDEELLADFRRLRLVEKTWGLKLESARDETGHADLAISFCVALMVIREIPPLSGLAWGGVIQTRNNIYRPAGTGEQMNYLNPFSRKV